MQNACTNTRSECITQNKLHYFQLISINILILPIINSEFQDIYCKECINVTLCKTSWLYST